MRQREESAAERWARFPRMDDAASYRKSLLNRGTQLYFMGERITEPSLHPVIRPSVEALALTYELAITEPELAQAYSPFIKAQVNRFLHIPMSSEDLALKGKMQRRLGQLSGTCFQRCTGMDALASLHSMTFDMDAQLGTPYHERFLAWLREAQQRNVLLAAGMTDPKGDRSLPPHRQHEEDVYLHVTARNEHGIYVRGAKAHMTGGWNQHWICLMPTLNMSAADQDFAVVAMVPGDAAGITYFLGRQSCDTRALEGHGEDQGNAQYAGQEVLVYFDNVFIPHDHVLMDGEYSFAQELVARFTQYHRASYICKTGLGDVLVGAAASLAEDHGVNQASHVKDKLVEMVHLNETIAACSQASAYAAHVFPSGTAINDAMLANVCKQNVTRFPYEISRLAQDLAGGLMVTLPGAADLAHEEHGPLLKRLLQGKAGVPVDNRLRMLRLIENMTLGRNAVGYLTESMHGAGSPQAQRIQIQRGMQIENKKWLARKLAGIVQG